MTALEFEVGPFKLRHNTHKWRMATNCHPATDGSRWGWIDGAPGNVCWNSATYDHAAEAVRTHNAWLIAQESPGLRLAVLNERRIVLEAKFKRACTALETHESALADVMAEMREIEK